MQKTYHAITIANQLIKLATDFNVSINPFKVQYILFLLQSSEIRFSNRKIFTERMQRVGWGYCENTVYDAYKFYGSLNIDQSDLTSDIYDNDSRQLTTIDEQMISVDMLELKIKSAKYLLQSAVDLQQLVLNSDEYEKYQEYIG